MSNNNLLNRKNRTWIFRLIIGVIVVRLVFVVGYGLLRSPESRLNTVLESETDCSVPCWQGLYPSHATVEDFQKLRGNLPNLSFGFVRRDRDYLNNPMYSWFDFQTGMPTEIYVENNFITSITFTPGMKARVDSQKSTLTLETVIKELGEPDFYTAQTGGPGFFVGLSFIYEDEGLVFGGIINERPPGTRPTITCKIPVGSDLPVDIIHLVEPGLPEEMMRDAVGEVFAKHQVIQEWPGLGEVAIKPCG